MWLWWCRMDTFVCTGFGHPKIYVLSLFIESFVNFLGISIPINSMYSLHCLFQNENSYNNSKSIFEHAKRPADFVIYTLVFLKPTHKSSFVLGLEGIPGFCNFFKQRQVFPNRLHSSRSKNRWFTWVVIPEERLIGSKPPHKLFIQPISHEESICSFQEEILFPHESTAIFPRAVGLIWHASMVSNRNVAIRHHFLCKRNTLFVLPKKTHRALEIPKNTKLPWAFV